VVREAAAARQQPEVWQQQVRRALREVSRQEGPEEQAV